MAVTIQAFYTELYQEFLEEASFLYEQRLSLFDDPEIHWPEIGDFEERFEAQIDGLVVGGAPALQICREQAVDGDAGELHAAVRLFCRRGRPDLATETMAGLDEAEPERTIAVAHALEQEMPQKWSADLVQLLNNSDAAIAAVCAAVIGYQRIPAPSELIRALRAHRVEQPHKVVWALGRLRDPTAAPLLSDLIQEDPRLAPDAALALMRMGDSQILKHARSGDDAQPWRILVMGLCGGASALPALLDAAASHPAPDAVIALGLLGDPAAMEVLLSRLQHLKTATAAAQAINLITGANLMEERFIPEEIDPDELFPEEVEKLEKGEPLHPPGEQPGGTVSLLTEDPERWHGWWRENGRRFTSGLRYRNGAPCTPSSLVETLAAPASPTLIRQLAYEELVIRYGVDIPFETDMVVSRQAGIIAGYARWARQNNPRFQPGGCYYAAQPVH